MEYIVIGDVSIQLKRKVYDKGETFNADPRHVTNILAAGLIEPVAGGVGAKLEPVAVSEDDPLRGFDLPSDRQEVIAMLTEMGVPFEKKYPTKWLLKKLRDKLEWLATHPSE